MERLTDSEGLALNIEASLRQKRRGALKRNKVFVIQDGLKN